MITRDDIDYLIDNKSIVEINYSSCSQVRGIIIGRRKSDYLGKPFLEVETVSNRTIELVFFPSIDNIVIFERSSAKTISRGL